MACPHHNLRYNLGMPGKKKTDLPPLGKLIRTRREEKGLTLRDVALSCGITEGYLSHIERNTREAPSPKLLLQIASTLSMSADDIMELFKVSKTKPTPQTLKPILYEITRELKEQGKEEEILNLLLLQAKMTDMSDYADQLLQGIVARIYAMNLAPRELFTFVMDFGYIATTLIQYFEKHGELPNMPESWRDAIRQSEAAEEKPAEAAKPTPNPRKKTRGLHRAFIEGLRPDSKFRARLIEIDGEQFVLEPMSPDEKKQYKNDSIKPTKNP